MLVWQWRTVCLNLFLSVFHTEIKYLPGGSVTCLTFCSQDSVLPFLFPLLGLQLSLVITGGSCLGLSTLQAQGGVKFYPGISQTLVKTEFFQCSGRSSTMRLILWPCPAAALLCFLSFSLWFSQVEHPWPTAVTHFPFLVPPLGFSLDIIKLCNRGEGESCSTQDTCSRQLPSNSVYGAWMSSISIISAWLNKI